MAAIPPAPIRRAPIRRAAVRWAPWALALAACAAPLSAQEQEPAGAVRLGLTYEPGYVPGMVIVPVSAATGLDPLAEAVGEILRTDLDYSDRFDIIELPDTVSLSGPQNYALWNQLGAVWLVTSEVSFAPGTQTPILRVGLHDVVYGNLANVQAFSLPEPGADDFRMAIHRVSDQIVSWATGGQRGIAATRIALRRKDGAGSSHILLIDSDGHNPRRLSGGGQNVFSPAYSRDGMRLAYTIQDETGHFALVEANLITGSRRTVASGTLLMSPAYATDGRLAYAEGVGGGSRILFEGAELLTEGRGRALNPSFSPDGAWFAYEAAPADEPQIYVRRISGGPARRISIYVRREDTNAAGPTWSPNGDRIAYAALSNSRWQIFTVNPDGTDRRMLTRRGESEDPSWAPDGRHIVFASRDAQGSAIWILDTATGRARLLTAGRLDGLPDWSPPLPPGS
ncbi:hypothetical protein [Candidatus Palauibacter sp.]|uniref:hypothetical protein n=1 Tax=Candidatus Palauibacter sp. TaxID=3101350 RepID=UPI003B5C30B8